jgi:alpha-L-fucosidase
VILSLNRPAKSSSTPEKRGGEAWRATDDDLMSAWSAPADARSAWLEIDLGKEQDISRCWISESEKGTIREFSIEAKEGTDWKELARGTDIGPDKVVKFPACKARSVRLNILKSEGPIGINEFQVFAQ